jgi:putative endonuclease
MVRCKNNSLYTGFSTDVEARVKTHNSGKGAKAVKMMGLPVELVYKEECNDLSSALVRESEIKKMTKNNKEKLINQNTFNGLAFESYNGILCTCTDQCSSPCKGRCGCNACRACCDDFLSSE